MRRRLQGGLVSFAVAMLVAFAFIPSVDASNYGPITPNRSDPGRDGPATPALSSLLLVAGAVSVTAVTGACIAAGACKEMVLRDYLEENELGVRAAVALGAGAELRELAHLLDVPAAEYVTFARFVRRHRQVVLGLAYEGEPRAIRMVVSLGLNAR